MYEGERWRGGGGGGGGDSGSDGGSSSPAVVAFRLGCSSPIAVGFVRRDCPRQARLQCSYCIPHVGQIRSLLISNDLWLAGNTDP